MIVSNFGVSDDIAKEFSIIQNFTRIVRKYLVYWSNYNDKSTAMTRNHIGLKGEKLTNKYVFIIGIKE